MSSSSSSTFHPGLTFATLVVQFAMTRGSVINSFEPRRKGSGESDTAVAAQPSATGSPNTSSSSQQISSASITSSIPTSSSASGSGASSGSSGSSSNTNTSSTSSSPVPSASSVTRTIIRSDITTAGIVGIAVGSVAILVLAYMFFTKCIRRNRRWAQGRDQRPGTGFLRMGSSSPVRPQTPVTEMSQTQSSPLISSAVVAGATISPHLSQYSMSNTPATLSPLIFPAPSPSLHHTRSLASTSDKSAANTHTSGVHTELSSHDALSYMSSLRGNILGSGNGILSVISRNISVSNSSSSSEPPASPGSHQSELHHAMTMYQKSLENDPKGLDVGRLHTDSEDVNDPPPSYDA